MLSDLLTERYQSLLDNATRIGLKREALSQQVESHKKDISTWREDILVLTKVEDLYKFLLNKYVHEYAESFSKIVTEGMQSIFHDQDISFEVDVTQKRGKVWVDFVTYHEGNRGQALSSFGGGIASVQSLLLRILVILKMNLAKYLVLDESLAALSEEYVENAGLFISKMCKDLDMNVLLITHNKSFLDYADNAYEASLDKDGNMILTKRR